ncbi:hypothetical protein HPB47_013342 [Ixodes persulcatus]|uniref:Uncharacterized protein n=1 Tax=Ixodes persulcatus TaxID=34615 RepID=A0AC60R219_IXOPE|nr:hypothetical protein HPB47_013342 [Ixodes persulcatus]
MQQDWAPDISVLPRITDATLEAFFAISDPSGRQREKAYRFAVEAYTEPSSVATQTSDTSSGIVHVRGTCFRSQKKTGLPYPVSVTFRAGDIAATACKCPAGKGGTCSHVLALLQLLMQLQKEGYKEPPPALSCTELPQQWRRPRQTGIAPASVQDVDWRRVCEGGSDVPRAVKRPASGSQRSESEVVASVRNLGGHLEVLGKCAFASVLLSSAGPLVPTKLGPAPSGSPAAYHQSRQLSGFTTWLVNIDPGTSRMLLVPGFQFPERDQYIFEEQHSERERAILDEISLCTEDACKLEQNTRQQSKSKTWGDARQHRLTASSFGKVLARQQWTERGLHNLLEPKDLTGVRAVQYGIKNEPLAVNRGEDLDVLKHHLAHQVFASKTRQSKFPFATRPSGASKQAAPATTTSNRGTGTVGMRSGRQGLASPKVERRSEPREDQE